MTTDLEQLTVKAEGLLQRAVAYASMETLNLSFSNIERTHEFCAAFDRMIVHYLCPNLPDLAREQLGLILTDGKLLRQLAHVPDRDDLRGEVEQELPELLETWAEEFGHMITPVQRLAIEKLLGRPLPL